MPEIGELFVGAYLRIIKGCPIIQYNARDEAQGAQGEVDVLGLDYSRKALYVCEVITHLSGAHYSKQSRDVTVQRIRDKFRRHRKWVATAFSQFRLPRFMLWSPYVSIGKKTRAFDVLKDTWPGPGNLELRINERYANAMKELIAAAAAEEKQRGEDFYRLLQLLTHLRGDKSSRLDLRLE